MQRSLDAQLRLESEVAGAVEIVLALAAKRTWKCHPDANFCSDQFVSFRMRKTELKRMQKRTLMMWMKKKVVMRMKVGIIGIGRMGGIRLQGNRRSGREIPSLSPLTVRLHCLKCYFS